MTVTDIARDTDALTLTITSDWDAPVDRVWELWADPRQLERWWGPPTFPATFEDHDLRPGGRVTYFMTGPEGERHHGWWRVTEVDEHRCLTMEDGFADADGEPDDTMPSTWFAVTFTEVGPGRTRMAVESRFPSKEALEQMLAMGMEEGLTAAIGQIEAILADD